MNKILAFVVVIFLVACASENPFKKDILGEWKGAEWLIEGKDSKRNVDAVSFQFNESGNYTAKNGNDIESGNYYLKGSKLYTTEKDALEKMVEIDFKGKDTLIMQMNRVGQAETLVLVKK